MTIDQDRGAYAPHMDAPLAFDARRPSDRRPLPMTLIASAGVLVLIVGALGMAYRGGVRGAETPKLVGEPVGAIKTAAAPEAASDAQVDSRMDVYAAQNVPSHPAAAPAPSFAPAPEQPKPRAVVPASAAGPAAVVAPRSQVASTAAPAAADATPSGLQVRTVDPVKVRIREPEVTTAPVLTASDRQAAVTSRTAIVAGAADRPAATSTPAARPVALAEAEPRVATAKPTKLDAAASKPAKPAVATRTTASTQTSPSAVKVSKPARTLRDADAEADTVKPLRTARADAATKPSKIVRADEAAPAKSAKGGAAAVQVGAFSSADLAQKGFSDAGKLSSLGGHARAVEKISRDGHTFYRATLGGFADKAAAKAFCAQLTAKGGRCLVKG